MRLAYVALGAALTFVSASGVSIWLARSADRGQPRPRLSRAWRAWTWGAIAGLALAAALSPWLAPAATFWALAAALQLIAQISTGGRGAAAKLSAGVAKLRRIMLQCRNYLALL